MPTGEHSPRRRAILALALLVPAPAIGSLAAFVFAPGTGFGQSLYLAAKVWIALLPVVWLLAVLLIRGSSKTALKSSAPSTRRSMIALSCAAFSTNDASGIPTVTSPAPIRSAPRAASLAAPPRPSPPESNKA